MLQDHDRCSNRYRSANEDRLAATTTHVIFLFLYSTQNLTRTHEYTVTTFDSNSIRDVLKNTLSLLVRCQYKSNRKKNCQVSSATNRKRTAWRYCRCFLLLSVVRLFRMSCGPFRQSEKLDNYRHGKWDKKIVGTPAA
jgi:hypothetical protein